MAENKTLSLRLEGVVQGVGMRYFIYNTAKNYGIHGYVKNMPDGSVDCVAQGKEDDIESFVKYIKNHSPGNITDMDKEYVEDEEHYAGFEITF